MVRKKPAQPQHTALRYFGYCGTNDRDKNRKINQPEKKAEPILRIVAPSSTAVS